MLRTNGIGLRACFGLASTLAMVACDDPAPREPTHFGPALRVRGRVVGAQGAPIAGARVEVRDPGMPDGPALGEVVTTTDAQGNFRLPPIPSDAAYALIVRHGDAAHTYYLRGYPRATGTHDTGNLRFGPDRELLVTAECSGALTRARPDGDPEPIAVRLESAGGPAIGAQLLAVDGDPARRACNLADPQAMPGVDRVVCPPAADARRFERRIRLPAGSYRVLVTGGCGQTQREITIPEQGDVAPLAMSLSLTPTR
ncbi:MAG: carboxypeptidase regulatory-like domain-containing protein [Deltaproteobacteria bacterium]|nr:carboxypeptidase regulatory-like domain-containing protein [Deltaproteobacteria bacterium]